MLVLALEAVFGFAVVTFAAFGAGSWIGTLLPSSFRRFERIAFVLLGGLGILSSTLFLVGNYSFTRTSIILILAAASFVTVVSSQGLLAKEPSPSVGRKIPRIPAAIVSFVLLLTAVSGLAEITGDWNSDTVAYHLLGPKVWLRDGVIRPVLDNSHTAFPQIPETLFAALWSVGGSRAPDFSSFLTFGLLLALAASVAIRLGASDAKAWWAAAVVATMPAVYTGGHGCFVDVIFAAFVIAATRIAFDARRIQEWLACGLFCSFAIGTKYTGLIAVPILLICMVLLKLKDRPTSVLVRGVAVAIGITLLIASPYYIRNWVVLGCPIYPPPPGYALLCTPKHFPAPAISEFHAYIRHRGFGLGRGFFAFLFLPFNLTYHTSNFHGAGGIGLLPFALGPIGILSFRKSAVVRTLALFAFLLTLAWFVTQQESRFLIHVCVFGAVFSILGWHAVASSQRQPSKYLAIAVLLLSVSYGLFMIVRDDAANVESVFSPTYAELRRQETVPYFASFDYLNRENSVRNVLILDRSVPPYYSDKNYVKPVGQWGELTMPNVVTDSQALAMAIGHQLNVSHVLDVNSEVSPFQVKPDTPGVTLIFEAARQRIYRID